METEREVGVVGSILMEERVENPETSLQWESLSQNWCYLSVRDRVTGQNELNIH